jgi:hypothetical protein
MPPVRLFARKVKNALTDKDSAARWPLACGASQRFFNQSGGWSISAWHRPGGGLTVLRSGQEHDAEKHVLGLDPRMDPHPGASFSDQHHAQLLGIDHVHAFCLVQTKRVVI